MWQLLARCIACLREGQLTTSSWLNLELVTVV